MQDIFYLRNLSIFALSPIGLVHFFCLGKGYIMKGKVKVGDVRLKEAKIEDAKLIHSLKYRTFLPLYMKYQDHETNPANEKIDKVEWQLKDPKTTYWLINYKDQTVGAIRVQEKQKDIYRIAPIFIIPEYKNRGIASVVLERILKYYENAIVWHLDTILEEKMSCHLYEKFGFTPTGKQEVINERMTIVYYEKINLAIRLFKDTDAESVSHLICRNFKEINVKDYGQEAVEELVKTHDAARVRKIASYANMYVFRRKEQIIAVGSISSFWGSLTESIILTVFVLPEYHKMGIGRKVIHTLEQDELFLRANRIEIPASITGVEFYRKLGYDYKNGIKELDEEGHYRLEKFQKPSNDKKHNGVNKLK